MLHLLAFLYLAFPHWPWPEVMDHDASPWNTTVRLAAVELDLQYDSCPIVHAPAFYRDLARELNDAPRTWERPTLLLPHHVVMEALRRNEEYVEFVQWRLQVDPPHAREAWLRSLDDARPLRHYWDVLHALAVTTEADEHRRALKELKERLGERGYWSGAHWSPVPMWPAE